MYLQGILSRETLVTTGTRERLHSQMNPLVTLQIVVPIETLRTLITLEWSFLIIDYQSTTTRSHHTWRSAVRVASQ